MRLQPDPRNILELPHASAFRVIIEHCYKSRKVQRPGGRRTWEMYKRRPPFPRLGIVSPFKHCSEKNTIGAHVLTLCIGHFINNMIQCATHNLYVKHCSITTR